MATTMRGVVVQMLADMREAREVILDVDYQIDERKRMVVKILDRSLKGPAHAETEQEQSHD